MERDAAESLVLRAQRFTARNAWCVRVGRSASVDVAVTGSQRPGGSVLPRQSDGSAMGKVFDHEKELAGSKEPALSPEMCDLIRRLSSFPHGLEFLDSATLECAAITFGVCPDVISRAREYLASSSHRTWFLDRVRRAQRQPPVPWHAPRPQRAALPPGPRTLAALVRTAHAHPYGLSFLLESPPETVAVVFHVHPQRVLRARVLFARWSATYGSRPDLSRPSDTSHDEHR